jgi:hypothetical protein
LLLFLVLVVTLTTGLSCTDPQVSEPVDKTWLSPGKIQVSNVTSGKHIEQNIKIHNGNEVSTAFLVYYRIPDYVESNFVIAPASARDWITIGEASPLLASRETKEIKVDLDVPNGIQTPARWEFWIGVKDNNENELTTELCSRWLITMKNK